MGKINLSTSLPFNCLIVSELFTMIYGKRLELVLKLTDFERKVSQRWRKSSLTKNLKHLIEDGLMYSYPICLIMEFGVFVKSYWWRSIPCFKNEVGNFLKHGYSQCDAIDFQNCGSHNSKHTITVRVEKYTKKWVFETAIIPLRVTLEIIKVLFP